MTQDIFIKLWRALPLYDGRAAVGTWLYTIARNTCLSAIRAEGYRRTSALDESVEPSALSTTPLAVSVEQCLSRLPDVQRQVVTLFYMQERSVSDVAAMLDLPEGTVKSHLHRARRALAVMMRRPQNHRTPERPADGTREERQMNCAQAEEYLLDVDRRAAPGRRAARRRSATCRRAPVARRLPPSCTPSTHS